MARYSIRIECLDGSDELRAELRTGIECEGYCLLLDRGEGNVGVSVHNMSASDIARIIADDAVMMKAAIIAKGYVDATMYESRLKGKKLGTLLAGALTGRTADASAGDEGRMRS